MKLEIDSINIMTLWISFFLIDLVLMGLYGSIVRGNSIHHLGENQIDLEKRT